MSKRVLTYTLNDGGEIHIEADVPGGNGGSGFNPAGTPKSGESEGPFSFEESLKPLKGVAEAIVESLNTLNTPSELKLDFGFGFKGKAGVFITSHSAETNFRVSLTWKSGAAKEPEKAAASAAPAPDLTSLGLGG